ncbi:MAG: chemotaxis response regulator protein-glutamate methylesterase [Rhizomicrobium sp.]
MSLSKPATVADPAEPIRVMLVDDSAVIRGVIGRWIDAQPGLKVVAGAFNGRMALDLLVTARPDIVILDIEMPGMDGITALPLLVKAAPHVRVIMASTLTRRNAEISLRALSLGATDYVAKPSALQDGVAADGFRRDLIGKILALGRPARRVAAPQQSLRTRPPSSIAAQIVAIGASTGGPQALASVIGGIAARLCVPVLVTQHMTATFTPILAEHLARISGLKCEEGRNGTQLLPRHVYVAPGDYHMLVKRRGGPIELVQTPPENYCRPSVDPMLRSVAATYGAAALAVVLTGMGADGREGARAIAASGGTVLAQDEATSVVWGMPGAVATAGLASAVKPLSAIADEILKHMELRG